MIRRHNAPITITLDITPAEANVCKEDLKKLGIDKDIGGWIPGPRITLAQKLVKAINDAQPPA